MTTLEELRSIRNGTTASTIRLPVVIVDSVIDALEQKEGREQEIEKMRPLLTTAQYLLYRTLALADGRIVSVEALKSAACIGSAASLLVHVFRLRQRLAELRQPETVVNVRGFGYVLDHAKS